MWKISASILSMLGLAALTTFLWNHRFQELSGDLKLDLPTLVDAHPSPFPPGIEWDPEKSTLTTTKLEGQAAIGIDLVLPSFPAVPFLHSSLELQAVDLKPNDEPWEDGRVSILWEPEAGDTDVVYLNSVRWGDHTDDASVVSSPATDTARAVIRIENMAKSGTLQIKRLELIAVQETSLWQVAQWILITLWTLWAAFVAGAFNQRSFKPYLAAVFWTIVTLKLVLPGPWHNSRPFGEPFKLAAPDSTSLATSLASNPKTPVASNPPDATSPEIGQKPPPQGGLLLQVRYLLRSVRPLLHAGFFFGLTIVLVLILRQRSAISLIVPIAIGVEIVQIGFGYGFDLGDLLDLAVDGVGIVAAIFILRAWFQRSGKPLWHEAPSA